MTPYPLLLKYRWQLLAAALALVLLAALGLRAWWGPRLAVATILRRDLVQTVVASGHVESPHRVDIAAQIVGTVASVPVVEGQVVHQGELLIQLDAAELRATEKQAERVVAQARAELRQLHEVQAPVARQTLRQAQVNLDNARTTQQRNEVLLAQGYISAAALDDSRKALDSADAALRAAQSQFDATRAAGSASALADANLAAATASLEAAQARSRYAQITAPVDGTLIGRNVEPGDVVQAGTVLMTLSPQGRTQLVVEVDEKSMRLLALGQSALASADAYPQQRFAAQVAYINPGIKLLTGAVAVKLDVASPPSTLLQDMTVSVDIEVARRPQALVVTTNSIHDADGPAPWVLRLRDGRAERSPLRLGLNAGGFSEVIEGLNVGDQVIMATSGVEAGDHIRPLLAAAPSAVP